jgi:arylsulfatase A
MRYELITWGLVVALSGTVGAAEQPPNIVIFLADDLGWGDLGCYGHPVIQTPHLDAFARQGTKLTQCYAASAVCSPSRSAILTGRTPYRNGVFTWIQQGAEVHLRTSELALPKLLRQQGYDTCHVGKWHLNGKFNDPAQPQPNDHGYNWWLATQNNASPSHKNPMNFVRNGRPVGPLEGYSAILVVKEALQWLREHRDRNKPFFLAVWTHEPHLPIETDPQFQKLYAQLPDPDQRQHHGNITQLDHAFGLLLQGLDELKLTDNTFIVFTSDNGPEGGGTKGRTRGSTGGLKGRKRALYEGGIRVPGIVRWPGRIPAGRVCEVPVIGTDLFPTLLRIAGAPIPKDRTLDGVDISPLLTGQATAVERPIPLFWRLDMAPYGLHLALRRDNWKLLASRDFSKFELYNLKADPRETTDLCEREPKIFAAMRQELAQLNAQVEAEGPDWWKRLNPNGGGPPQKKK